jgi:hypothetical protein
LTWLVLSRKTDPGFLVRGRRTGRAVAGERVGGSSVLRLDGHALTEIRFSTGPEVEVPLFSVTLTEIERPVIPERLYSVPEVAPV